MMNTPLVYRITNLGSHFNGCKVERKSFKPLKVPTWARFVTDMKGTKGWDI